MRFDTRSEFISAQASEKITLAHVHATARLYSWTAHAGSVYKKVLPYVLVDLREETTSLTQVSSIGAVTLGKFYYDFATSTVYAHVTGGVDPSNLEMIGLYRLFFASGPVTASWDLTDTGVHVFYNGRIQSAPGYDNQIGIDQGLISIVGSGTLKLENNDVALQNVYDKLIFENQQVNIYSWNRGLEFSEARRIFRGRITDKAYDDRTVSFKIKDDLYNLLERVPHNLYQLSDGVNKAASGKPKRWVYGRADGLKCQSIDQIGSGYTLTGVGSADGTSQNLTGFGTFFLDECSPGDKIIIGTLSFRIESVNSSTSITLDKIPDYPLAAQSMTLVPERAVTTKNRVFQVLDHAGAQLTKTVTKIVQLNKIELNDVEGLLPGDFVKFNTNELIEIQDVLQNNQIKLRQNVTVRPTVGTSAIRPPIQQLFLSGKKFEVADYTVNNTSAGLTVTFSSDAEFNIAPISTVGIDFTWTNGLREVTAPSNVDLSEHFESRDWIRPSNPSYTTWYEILSISGQTITLRTTFSEAGITDTVERKQPEYIGDETVVSANVLGRTTDNQPTGEWIVSGPQAVLDLLGHAGVTDINTAKFTEAHNRMPHLISLALPLSPEENPYAIKTAIDYINQTVLGSVTLDENQQVKYEIVNINMTDDPVIIRDFDIISWKATSTNGKLYKYINLKYRFQDVDLETQETGSLLATTTSDFVSKYVGTNNTLDQNVYFYDTNIAEIFSHRYAYYHRLSRTEINIVTDLRLENVAIGDVVMIDLEKLYTRFGSDEVSKKMMKVTAKKVTGERIELELSDLGNTFNTSSYITPNSAPAWASADDDDKLKYGYITANNGLVANDETTANTHLIS